MAGINKDELTEGFNSQNKENTIVPGVTTLYNKDYKLEIEHLPSGYKVAFAAFLDNFSDAYTQTWNAEDVYGRMDPIAVYQHTRRAIAMSWHVPAASIEQAKLNMDVVNALMTFMYPSYRSGPQKDRNSKKGNVINVAPLLRVKFLNLIHNGLDGNTGLLGYVNGFTVDVRSEDGIFMSDDDGVGGPAVYPKTLTLNFELNVLHEHPMGWEVNGNVAKLRGSKDGFPYRTNLPMANPTQDFGDRVPTVSPPGGGGSTLTNDQAQMAAGQILANSNFGFARPAGMELIRRAADLPTPLPGQSIPTLGE